MITSLESFRNIIARWTEDGEKPETAIPGLGLYKYTEPTEMVSGMYEPGICLVAQGAKRVSVGKDTFVYNSENYLLTSVHLPTVWQVAQASEEKPYLGLVFTLNLHEVSQMMVESKMPAPQTRQSTLGMTVGKVTGPLLDAFNRLVGLLDDEKDIPILAPTIQREIIYRLLTGDQSARLRQIATMGSQSRQIAQAIKWMKSNFEKPLRMDEIAKQANMSKSTFHSHFRSMTAMSPLQYQKNLRLQEARRLMLAEKKDAATAAFEVGYESPSQFSREYSRLFGAPPLRDIKNLSQTAAGEMA